MAKLFEKNIIGGVELKNRLGMGPMGFGHTDADGGYSDRQIEYYVERAKGGYGLIYPTATKVSSKFEPSPFPNILQDSHHGTRLNIYVKRYISTVQKYVHSSFRIRPGWYSISGFNT